MSKITDTPYKEPINDKRKYATKEEAYEAHKARVKQWQKDNPDKFLGYVKKYQQNPDVKKKRLEAYHNMDPVKKAELLEKQSIRGKAKYWAMKKEDRREENHVNYDKYKERIREYNRERYANMTPEAKAILSQKRREYRLRKQKEQDEYSRQESKGQITSSGSEGLATQDVS